MLKRMCAVWAVMCLVIGRVLYLSPIDYRGIFVVANNACNGDVL